MQKRRNRARVMIGMTKTKKVSPHHVNNGCPQPARNLMPVMAERSTVKIKGPKPTINKNNLSEKLTSRGFSIEPVRPIQSSKSNASAGIKTWSCSQKNFAG